MKALSEPVRLRILLLLEEGELCVCDLMAALEMPQSTVSRHVAQLKNAGLVAGQRCGKWTHYRRVEPHAPYARLLCEAIAAFAADDEQAAIDRSLLLEHLARKTAADCV
ncbi:MAG: ArsR/SmtB family transcription factor, partial [Oceanidesulfovibrio sp.]